MYDPNNSICKRLSQCLRNFTNISELFYDTDNYSWIIEGTITKQACKSSIIWKHF